jgi:hypothetical protein
MGESLAVGKPRRHRQMPVRRIGLSAFEFDEPSSTLGLDDAARSFELVQVGGERTSGERADVLGSEFVQGGSKRAHIAHHRTYVRFCP